MMHLFLANGGPGGTNLDPLYDTALFWILAVLAVSAALAMILVRHAVHCALMLAVVMLCLAVMYAMQGAPFLAFVQVIVYTGAVLMLFLFVVMLIGTNSIESLVEVIRGQRLWAALAGIGLAVLLIVGIGHAAIGSPAPQTAANSTDNLTGLARLIFTTYVFPFEVTSALLITAALGAMVLAHRERTTRKPTQREVAPGQDRQRPGPARAAARRLRPAQRRRHAGHAAGRHAVGPFGVARGRRPRRPARPRPAGGRHRRPRHRRADRRGAGDRIGRPGHRGEWSMSPASYIFLAVILFVIGAVGVLVRRNAILIFLSVELMLNSCNLAFVSFSRLHGNLDGQVVAFFVMVVAAAEVVVGLAILMAIYRARRSASVDDANLLKN